MWGLREFRRKPGKAIGCRIVGKNPTRRADWHAGSGPTYAVPGGSPMAGRRIPRAAPSTALTGRRRNPGPRGPATPVHPSSRARSRNGPVLTGLGPTPPGPGPAGCAALRSGRIGRCGPPTTRPGPVLAPVRLRLPDPLPVRLRLPGPLPLSDRRVRPCHPPRHPPRHPLCHPDASTRPPPPGAWPSPVRRPGVPRRRRAGSCRWKESLPGRRTLRSLPHVRPHPNVLRLPPNVLRRRRQASRRGHPSRPAPDRGRIRPRVGHPPGGDRPGSGMRGLGRPAPGGLPLRSGVPFRRGLGRRPPGWPPVPRGWSPGRRFRPCLRRLHRRRSAAPRAASRP